MVKIKALFGRLGRKAKLMCALGAMSCFAAVSSVVASAEEPTGSSALASNKDAIIQQFTSAASDITPIIVGVLGAGLSIFVIFVGIKLAKKMFSTVSK